MEYRRHKVDEEYRGSTAIGKCIACKKKFSKADDQFFFMSDCVGTLHDGFLCVKCANEYEGKYFKKVF